jgi:signal transduction histidine kinase
MAKETALGAGEVWGTMSTVGFQMPLWRSVAVYRIVSLIYAGLLIAQHDHRYRHPLGGWAVLTVMIVWTGVACLAYARPQWRRLPLLLADLTIAVACLVTTSWVETAARLNSGVANVTGAWVCGSVLAWAVAGGRGRGVFAATVLTVADLGIHGWVGPQLTANRFNGNVLLLIAAFVVGHVARLATDAEDTLARAVRLATATRERERIARDIHDSVLQVLTLVQRRGAAIGGEAAELGRLAGEQEAVLRTLIGTAAQPAEERQGQADLRTALNSCASATVTVSAPVGPVLLPAHVTAELTAAVQAALDNVRRHCGQDTLAWVLLEDDADTVTISVRDDGPGIARGRLDQANQEGRLGVTQSIQGRVRDLGGSATIMSVPGQGTEIELRVPHSRNQHIPQ